MSAPKQKLVWGILDFLTTSLNDGTIKEEDKEGVEVAMQCIGEAFGVDHSDSTYSIKPATLSQIFAVYTQMEEKRKGAAPAASTSTAAPTASSSGPKTPSAADKEAAEKLKTTGNQLMARKAYNEAIAKYTAAIDLDPTSPVFYSNRAAAYSQVGNHADAISDARKAAEVDPTFSKAYSRLGHALFSSGKFSDAVEAYEKGLELDPANASMRNSLTTARARASEADAAGGGDDDDDEDSDSVAPPTGARGPGAGGMPDLSSLLGGLGGGGGGGGGMPDLSSIMQNPMMMQMAQQMMANGGLERLMANPQMRQMAESFGRGGGMPDMASMAGMMQDPAIRQMAEQFGAGRGRGGGAPGNSNNNDNMYS